MAPPTTGVSDTFVFILNDNELLLCILSEVQSCDCYCGKEIKHWPPCSYVLFTCNFTLRTILLHVRTIHIIISFTRDNSLNKSRRSTVIFIRVWLSCYKFNIMGWCHIKCEGLGEIGKLSQIMYIFSTIQTGMIVGSFWWRSRIKILRTSIVLTHW